MSIEFLLELSQQPLSHLWGLLKISCKLATYTHVQQKLPSNWRLVSSPQMPGRLFLPGYSVKYFSKMTVIS